MPLLNEAANLRLGNNQVRAVFLGSDRVWPRVVLRTAIRPSALTNFVSKIDLSTMPARFWSKVSADGGNIRISTAAGVNVPLDVVWINKTTKLGVLFFKATINGAATIFNVDLIDGETMQSSSIRQSVWSDYDFFLCGVPGGDYVNRVDDSIVSGVNTSPTTRADGQIDFGTSRSGSLLFTGLPNRSIYTLSAGVYSQTTHSNNTSYLAYGNNSSPASGNTQQMIDRRISGSLSRRAAYNNGDAWREFGDVITNVFERRAMTQNGTSGSDFFLNGGLALQDASTSARPTGTPTRLHIGGTTFATGERMQGLLNDLYLRPSLIDEEWAIAEDDSWRLGTLFSIK